MDISSFILGLKMGGSGGGGGDITVEQLNVSSNNTYTAPSGKAYSPVVVNVPNTYAAGDEGKVVSNGALVSQTSDTVTQNGTVDTTLINSLLVNVAGGASNIKTGTFIGAVGDSNLVVDVDTEYTGNGYPIAVLVCVDGGAYNPAITEWYDSNKSGNVGIAFLTKTVFTSPPSYNGGSDDKASYFYAYKSNTGYSRAGNIENTYYTQTAPINSLNYTMAIKDKHTIRCYVNQAADYGFAAGVTYRYWAIYSE